LETLTRQMRNPTRWIAQRAFLRLLALERGWRGVLHQRAALALGYYDFSHDRYDDAIAWFRVARGDPVLGRYALYWEGVAAGQAGQDSQAIELLGQFLRAYPYSIMRKRALSAFADAAIDGNEPKQAIAALVAYPGTFHSAGLMLHLALARERAGDLLDAALDFQRVYDLFPMQPQARDAALGIDRMRDALGARYPELPVGDRVTRAEILFRNRQWHDARLAWIRVRDEVGGRERERAILRVAECDTHIYRNPAVLLRIQLPDPEINADRWLAVINAYWDRGDEDEMKLAVQKVLQLTSAGAPPSMGDEALFVMGNYYWVNLERNKAAAYYQQMLARDAQGEYAVDANWRVAWTSYLENKPDTAVLMRSHIERYPYSPYVPDALYWLGRLAQRQKHFGVARAYYSKLASRFVETFFGQQARARLRQLGTQQSSARVQPVLGRIPPLPRAYSLVDSVPASLQPLYDRARALRSIAFDGSAMRVFRRAYRISKAPQLLIDAARTAQADNHYLTGAALVRLLVPDLESRPFDTVPMSIWRIVYPLPYAPLIRYYAGRYGLNPMLLASLIRQESGFQPDAISGAGAIGLAQLMPFTALKWSRMLRLWYSRGRLLDPQYNLALGGAYLQALIKEFHSPEAALAAYNAGEVRVAQWLADFHDPDPARFVESIPFTQTRDYVQIVLGGASIYQRLYGGH
jgi:soluble lytic murein transglycosylase